MASSLPHIHTCESLSCPSQSVSTSGPLRPHPFLFGPWPSAWAQSWPCLLQSLKPRVSPGIWSHSILSIPTAPSQSSPVYSNPITFCYLQVPVPLGQGWVKYSPWARSSPPIDCIQSTAATAVLPWAMLPWTHQQYCFSPSQHPQLPGVLLGSPYLQQ